MEKKQEEALPQPQQGLVSPCVQMHCDCVGVRHGPVQIKVMLYADKVPVWWGVCR